MPICLSEEVYRSMQKSLEKYSDDYEALKERTEIIENQEKERIIRDEANYKLFEKFGAIM